jgi:ribosomal protein S27E
MAELHRPSTSGSGLYERLLHRLEMALDEADTAEGLRDEHPEELELRGLSSAEMELIRAYLDQDVHWLRGWHAAAEELALLERGEPRNGRTPRLAKAVALKPRLSHRHLQLLCALCGTPVAWSRSQGVMPCSSCGSQLFRGSRGR